MAQDLSFFTRFSNIAASATGKPATFILAVTVVVVWAFSGPVFRFSDTWRLVINTGTTIVTFLMVFLIQNTQNREAITLQLKLDELICAAKEANNEILNIEESDEKELNEKRSEMARLAEDAKASNGNSNKSPRR